MRSPRPAATWVAGLARRHSVTVDGISLSTHIKGNAIAYVALFIALGGTS